MHDFAARTWCFSRITEDLKQRPTSSQQGQELPFSTTGRRRWHSSAVFLVFLILALHVSLRISRGTQHSHIMGSCSRADRSVSSLGSAVCGSLLNGPRPKDTCEPSRMVLKEGDSLARRRWYTYGRGAGGRPGAALTAHVVMSRDGPWPGEPGSSGFWVFRSEAREVSPRGWEVSRGSYTPRHCFF